MSNKNILIQKLLLILETDPQRRQLSDITTLANVIPSSQGYSHSCFVAFYCKPHPGPANITSFLEYQSQVYLIKGSMTIQKGQEKQKIKINQPTKIVLRGGMKIIIDDNSFAISVTRLQAKNCLTLKNSTLNNEIQFLKSIQPFSKLSRIVCSNIIYSTQVRIYHGQQIIDNQANCLYLVREGQFQFYEDKQSQIDDKLAKYKNSLITFNKGCFFKIISKARCKSSIGKVYVFSEQYVKNYIQVLIGDKITLQTSRIQKYLTQKSKSVDTFKKVNLNYLTQTKFRPQPKIQLRPLSQNHQTNKRKRRSISSSKNPQQGFTKYQQLQKLQAKRNMCLAYKQLFPLKLNTKQQILLRMYKSIKNDLQVREKEKRESKKTLIL